MHPTMLPKISLRTNGNVYPAYSGTGMHKSWVLVTMATKFLDSGA